MEGVLRSEKGAVDVGHCSPPKGLRSVFLAAQGFQAEGRAWHALIIFTSFSVGRGLSF